MVTEVKAAPTTVGTPPIESGCDFNCGKLGEPLIYFTNPRNGHRWACHPSCLKERVKNIKEASDEEP